VRAISIIADGIGRRAQSVAHCAAPARKRREADVFAPLPKDPPCLTGGVRASLSLRPGRRGCFHPRPPQTRTCRFPASGSADRRSVSTGRESNPLDRGERFQLVLTIIPPPALLTLAQCASAYCALPATGQYWTKRRGGIQSRGRRRSSSSGWPECADPR
jgi:hypothetical protein